MAASGYSPISLYYSTTASATPTNTNLVNGELALNITDGKLFYKDNAGTVQTLATKSSAISPVTNNGVVYINSSGQGTSGSALTFNGTNLSTTGVFLKGSSTSYSGYAFQSGNQDGFAVRNAANNAIGAFFGAGGSVSLSSSGDYAVVNGSSGVIFGRGVSEDMRLTSTGLGIGTSSPSQLLQARKDQAAYTWMRVDNQTNSASAYAGLAIGANGNTWGITVGSSAANSNALNFVLDATGTNASKMTLDSSGNLGLGVTPSYKFQVKGLSNNVSVAFSDGTANDTAYILKMTSGRLDHYATWLGSGINAYHSWWVTNSVGTQTQALTLNASGNLLVGTTSQTYLGSTTFKGLFVNGSANASIGVAGGSYTVANYGQLYLSGGYGDGGTRTSGFFIRSQASGGGGNVINDLTFVSQQTNGGTEVEYMRLDNSGNLGIGTSSPSQKLTVSGSAAFSRIGFNANAIDTVSTSQSFVRFQSTGADFYLGTESSTGGAFFPGSTAYAAVLYNANSTPMHFYTNAGLRMTLDSSGNLGIGTSSPGTKLQVYGTAVATQISIDGTGRYKYFEAYASGTRRFYSGWDETSLAANLFTDGAHPITFGTNGSERARIDSSGNLLVGKTSLSDSTNGIQLRADGAYILGATSSGSECLMLNRNTSDGSIALFKRSNTQVGSISVTTTATAYNTSSDYRLKNVTGPLTGYKERLMSLQPKQGTWIADGTEFRGFLAHEFAVPYRASVSGEKDAVDQNGKPIIQGMQASTSEVMADLIAMVKDLVTENESLRARVAQLESN